MASLDPTKTPVDQSNNLAGAITAPPTPLTPTPSAPTQKLDPVAGAKQVLDGGIGRIRDNDDERAVAFGNKLDAGDPTYGEQLTKEIAKQDPGAFTSWLTPERVNGLQDSGRITAAQKEKIVEAYAGAYNSGQIPSTKQIAGPTPGTGADGEITASALDKAVRGPNGPNDVNYAQEVRAFSDFIGSSNGPQAAEFRAKYGQHLIDQYVLNSAVGQNNPTQRDAAAGVAANLLGGDPRRPGIAPEVLSKYNSEDIQSIMKSAARSNDIFGQDVLKTPAADRGLDVNDVALPSGSASLFRAVALDRSSNADKVATDFARLPANSPDMFAKSSPGGADNVNGLTLSTATHSDAVLKELTTLSTKGNSSKTNPNGEEVTKTATELGSLLKTTMLNPAAQSSGGLESKVVDYANDLGKRINEPGPGGDAVNRMAMLQAGVREGVRQGYSDLAKSEAKQKEVAGFMFDLALSALPAGKWASSAAENVIADTFGATPKVQDALKGLSGKLIDKGTGKLTDEAKSTILATLGQDEGNLAIAQKAANNLNDSFQRQIDPKDYDANQIVSTYLGIIANLKAPEK